MNKTVKIIIALLGVGALTAGFLFSKYYWSDSKNLNAIYLIPRNAIYFISSDQPVKNWKKVRNSELWQHLQTNTYFAELTQSFNTFDSVLNENEKLFDLIGSKKLLVSTHPISKYKYDYLFIIDLKKTAKLLQFQSVLKNFLPKNYTFSQRDYKGVEIMELFDSKTRETLYVSVIDNNLIASYTHTLIEASIDQLNEPTIGRDLKFLEINQHVRGNKLFQLFVQYNYVDEFVFMLSRYSGEWVTRLSENLVYSGFDLDLISGKKLVAKGFTNMNDTMLPYMEALQNSGIGKHQIATVAPHRTSMYFSLSFENFKRFYDNYNQIQHQTKAFETLEENKKKIEDLLDIKIQKNFISWMDDEVALLKLEPINKKSSDNFALVFKSNDIAATKKNMNYVLRQIKKKTPVKFNEISYKGHPIKFMSIKGFFKMFLGGYFKQLETPYYTIIDQYVIFSNHPNTLKYIITNYEEKNTLKNAANYKAFITNFDRKSNLFIYINTPMIFQSIVDKLVPKEQKLLQKNKKYLTSFSQIGIQLSPEDNLFKSQIVIQYKDPESIRYSDEFKAPTVHPFQEDTQTETNTKPIVVEQIDPMQTLQINPGNLNDRSYTEKYPNGKVHVTVALKEGRKNGLYKEYYKNGSLRLKGRFKNDKKTGMWKKYDIHGKLILKKRY